jgi:hypothetical protein
LTNDVAIRDRQIQEGKNHTDLDRELLELADELSQDRSAQIEKLVSAIADKDRQIEDLVFYLRLSEDGNGLV